MRLVEEIGLEFKGGVIMKIFRCEIEEILNDYSEVRFQTYIFVGEDDDCVDIYSADSYNDGLEYYIKWLKRQYIS